MRRYTKYILKHPLFAGSAVMIVGNNFVNFGNYIYHLLMGRLLGPASYGELASLISVLVILGIIPFSLGLVITKFVSASKSKTEVGQLIGWFERSSILFGVVIGVLMFMLTPFIASFLHLSGSFPITILSFIFFFSVVNYFNRAALQGLIRFGRMVSTSIVEVLGKVGLGVLLVFLGYSVVGALGGWVVGAGISAFFTHLFLKDYLNKSATRPHLKPMLKYALPVFVQSAAASSLYSTDLVLVKHFFDAHSAGLYASLSVLGRIIFFGTAPIATVMFPIVSQRQAKGQDYKKIFLYSFGLTFIGALAVLSLYWLFPELAIRILFGSLYLEASGLLVWFGVFITLFSLSSLLVYYHLSLGQTSVVVLPALAAVLQAGGIWFFHNSLFQVILISIFATGLLLLGLLVYFGYAAAKERK